MRAMHADGEVVYLANDVEVEIARLRGKIDRQRAHLRGASAEGRRKNKALRSMNKTISRLQKRIAELEARLAAAEAENTRIKRQVETLKTGWGIADRDRIKAEAGEDALAEALRAALDAQGPSTIPEIVRINGCAALAAYEARRR